MRPRRPLSQLVASRHVTHYTGNRQFDLSSIGPSACLITRTSHASPTLLLAFARRRTSHLCPLARTALRAEGDAEAVWRLHGLWRLYVSPPLASANAIDMSAHSTGAPRSRPHRHAIPYRDGELAAMRWEADRADRAPAPSGGTPHTLIMMNGFVGMREEIIDCIPRYPSIRHLRVRWAGARTRHWRVLTLEPGGAQTRC